MEIRTLNDRLMRTNILLDRICDALEKKNELKEKELEFIKYNTELRLKELQDNQRILMKDEKR